MIKRNLVRLALMVSATASALFAQAAAQQRMRVPAREPGALIPGPPGIAGLPGDATFQFVAGEFSFERRVVTGAPYSAEAIAETQQTLADGTRISRRNTIVIYRDSEGRTRREITLGAIGPWASRGEPRQTVFINDPVAGVSYVLDPQERTARKLAMRRPQGQSAEGSAPPPRFRREPPAGRPQPDAESLGKQTIQGLLTSTKGLQDRLRTESLGKQTIEGVEAEGTRTTVTIPAGEIGNDRPLEIVNERWYSPELQVVVLSRRSDPRAGETTYRLTNIRRTEPLRTLFEPPPDYAVREGGPLFNRRTPPSRRPGQ